MVGCLAEPTVTSGCPHAQAPQLGMRSAAQRGAAGPPRWQWSILEVSLGNSVVLLINSSLASGPVCSAGSLEPTQKMAKVVLVSVCGVTVCTSRLSDRMHRPGAWVASQGAHRLLTHLPSLSLPPVCRLKYK